MENKKKLQKLSLKKETISERSKSESEGLKGGIIFMITDFYA